MSDPIKYPSARQPVLNADGTFTRAWFLFFQFIYDRVGGAIAPTNNELDSSLFEDAGNSELVAQLLDIQKSFGQWPSMPELSLQIDVLQGENNFLRDQLTEMQQAIQALQQITSA